MKPLANEEKLPTGLPKELQPWGQSFQNMPEENLRLLGGLMGQLNTFLSEAFAVENDSLGEFNGYDGMALRGEIERLMPSEWLWKDLHTEEFLRRFAERELMYHKPAYESPADERVHLVVLDSGPEMLGRPRLVALASLLCLNVIARKEGARLLWMAPQAGITGWNDLLIQNDLKKFLESANAISLNPVELEKSLEHLPAVSKDQEVILWTVGSSPLLLEKEELKINQITVSEQVFIGEDTKPQAEAQIDLQSYSGRLRTKKLSYPQEDDCVRLLWEPYRPEIPRQINKNLKNGQGNPDWAAQSVITKWPTSKILIRTKNGLILADTGWQSRFILNAVEVKLKDYDRILGVMVVQDYMNIAIQRVYNGFSQILIRRIDENSSKKIIDVRIDEEVASEIGGHQSPSLPRLTKPGRQQRYLIISSNGKRHIITKSGIEQDLQLPHLPLIGCKGNNAWLISGKEENGKRLIMRDLSTLRVLAFSIDDRADIRSEKDIICLPENPDRMTSTMLFVHCNDGAWRGRETMPNITTDTSDSSNTIELNLPENSIVLGPCSGMRYTTRCTNYSMIYVTGNHKQLHYCGITADGEVIDEHLLTIEEKLDGACLIGENIIGWQEDETGYPETFYRYSPTGQETKAVPDMITVRTIEREAACPSV